MISAGRRIAVLGVLTLAVLAGAASEARAQITFDPPTQPDLNFQVGTPVNVTLPLATSTASSIRLRLLYLTSDPNQQFDTSNLVPGLVVDFAGTNRTITGTPTRVGAVELTYLALDIANNSETLDFTITITEALALPTLPNRIFETGSTITPIELPVPTGGTAPYTYSLTGPSSAALPSGLAFATGTRMLSGTPDVEATTELTYTVMDSATTPAMVTGTFNVIVTDLVLPTLSNRTFETGSEIAPVQLPEATGGTAPYRYTLTGQGGAALPSGLAFATGTRTLSGTPDMEATTELTYSVTDSATTPATVTGTFDVTVAPVIHIDSITRANDAPEFRNDLEGIAFDVRLNEPSDLNEQQIVQIINVLKYGDSEFTPGISRRVEGVDDQTFRVRFTSTSNTLALLSATENNIVSLVFNAGFRMQDIIPVIPSFFGANLSTTLPTGDANYETYTVDLKAPALAATGGVAVRDSGDAPLNSNDPWAVGEEISVTWTFDEPMNGFTEDDLEIVGTGTDNLGLSVDNFTGDDGATTFSADLTLTGTTAADTATLQVDEAGITDRAGNNPAGPISTFVFAIERPRIASIVRRTPTDEVTNADVLQWTVTFSIPVKNVDRTDFAPVFTDLAGMTITPSNPPAHNCGFSVCTASTGNTQWTIVVGDGVNDGLFDNTYNGKIGLTLAENHDIVSMDGDIPLTDATPTGENQTFTVDNTAPMVTLSSPGGGANLRSPFTLTVAFSEAVPGFVPTSANVVVAVSGVTDAAGGATTAMATLGAFTATTANQAWTAPVTLTAERRGAITANIAADVAMDAAGNRNTAATEFSATFDTTDAPSISAITRHTPTTERTNADRLTWEVVFSEVVNGVDAADFEIATPASGTATTATITGVAGDGATWRVTASGGDLATYNGEVGIALASAQDIMDVDPPPARLLAFDGDAPTFIVDNAAPALTITAAPTTVGVGGTSTLTFTFSEEPSGFALGDVTPSGAISNLSGTGTTRTATFTAGPTPAAVTIRVAAGAWSDQAGNPGAVATATLTVSRGPVPTITGQPLFTDGMTAFEVTITFDPGVSGFAAGDITATGAAVSAPTASGGGNTTYTATVTPSGGAITLRIAAGAADGATGTPLAGVPSVAASVSIPVDDVAPTLDAVRRATAPDAASGLILDTDDDLAFRVTFDEPVLAGPESPNPKGSPGMQVDCEDFTEPTDFDCHRVERVAASTASATLQNDESDYARTFDVFYRLEGGADQVIYLDVGIGLATGASILDRGGNGVADAAPATEAYEAYRAVETTVTPAAMSGAPAVVVSAPQEASGRFNVWVRFNEPVTDFEPTPSGGDVVDVVITGGTIAEAEESVTGSRWTLSIQPSANEVTIVIPAGAAMDNQNMDNTASSPVRIAVRTQSEREMVADFMQRRGAQIMAARPNLFGLLDGSGIGTSSLNLDDGPNRTFAFAGTGREIAGLFGKTSRGLSLNEADRAAARGDLWVSLKGIRTRTDDAEDDFYSMSVGAHRRLGADRIAGAFIAVDQSKTEGRGEARDDSVEGDGWLAGPYLVGRVAERGLYYQVHAAWGQSSNAVRVGEGGENSFDTDRYLVGGALKGDYQLGEWSISPVVSADWFREEQGAYTSGGTRVADQDITLGEVRAGPQFRRVLRLDSGADLSFKLGLHGVHNLAVDAEGDAPGTFEDGDTRGQVDVDFGYALNGAHLDLGLRYDGIGQDDYESWGADLRLRVTF